MANPFTFEQVRSYPLPKELTAAPVGAKAAWVFVQQGIYNLWVAEGPEWTARRVTGYHEDDGQEITNLRFTADGQKLVYVRGGDHHANWPAPGNLQPNPNSSPIERKIEIYGISFTGGAPQLLAEGDLPEISPQGDRVAFIRDHQVWSVPLDGSGAAARLFFARGKCSGLQWSPDGAALAFVSDHDDHSFIGIYRSEAEPIRYLAPSTGWDTSPRWSPDGRQIAFVRMPGDHRPRPLFTPRPDPWLLWVADAATGEARCLFENPATLPGLYPRMQWDVALHWGAGDRLLFRADFEGWPHLYSLPASGDEPPLLLTPGEFMVEDVAVAPDRTFAVYTANTGDDPEDIDRRHLWRCNLGKRENELLTGGTRLEFCPVISGDGGTILFLSADARRPSLPAALPTGGGRPQILAADQLPNDFPADRLLTPIPITITAADGTPIRCQRFEAPAVPASNGTGKKPALIFVHGGPIRQMLLGWHNFEYYANAYALNQYFAHHGYVALSVNYRLGIGYGHALTHPADAGSAGASEYRDILAAGEYLRSDPAVDPARIGIWGGSCGGFLTALALGRNSDVFAAGVDFCGVHDWTVHLKDLVAGQQARVEKIGIEEVLRVAWESSPVSAVSTWKSPVLLIHGDDDRNVEFHQTVDLALRLREAGVPVEELVFPDDTHALRCYRHAMQANKATIQFFDRVFG